MTVFQNATRAWSNFFANLIDPEMPPVGAPPKTLFAFFGWALAGCWPLLGVAAISMVIAASLEVVSYALLARLVDLAEVANRDTLWADHGALFIWFVVVSVCLRPMAFAVSASINAIGVGPGLGNLVLSRIHAYVTGHAVTFFDEDFAGRISQKEMQTTRALVDVIQEMLHAIVFALTMVIGTAALFAGLSVWLLVMLLIWLAMYLAFLWAVLPRMRLRSQARAGERAKVTGQIVDIITNMRTVKLFAARAHEQEATYAYLRDYRVAAIHWANLASFFRVGLIFLGGLLPSVLMGYGLWMWQVGDLSAGGLAAIGALTLRLSQMTGWVSWTLLGIFSNLGEIEDGVKTLTPDYTLDDADATLAMATPDIRFEGIHFKYGADIGGVEGIDLHVNAGEKIGLVGASGAGKSTLLSLALRLYDPELGRILVSGQDLRDVAQDSLRGQISMVTQETAMFNRSARENIRYGTPDAPEDAVVAAARQAEALDFISDLRDFKGRVGMDAHLGERGVKLSGGQRQRIALARAILKDAPILLLDEATSALDSEVEAQIQAALAQVMEGKTVIAIAHRLSTIARMDRIVVMDQGRIVEQGSHDDLLADGGVYAKLWAHQTGGFLKV